MYIQLNPVLYAVTDASAESTAADRAEIVHKKYFRLVHELGPFLEPLANKFFGLGVINLDTVDTVNKTDQPTKKRASILLDAIIENMKSDGKSFDYLISALHKVPELSFLGDELETEMKLHISTRNVVTFHPRMDRSISLPTSATSGDSQPKTDVKKNGTAVTEASQTTSKFEFAFPKVLKKYDVSLIIDDEPVINEPKSSAFNIEAVAESSTTPATGSSAIAGRQFQTEVSDPSLPDLIPAFTYSRSAVPIPVAYYDESTVEASKEESGNNCIQERVVKSEDQYGVQVKKVQKLKMMPGYLVSQKDSEIAAKTREYEKKSRQLEEARKVRIEKSEQSEELGEQSLAEEEKELRVLIKDLCDLIKRRDENLLKVIECLEKNFVPKVEEEDTTETTTETIPQPNEPGESSKLLETPSHTDAFIVMLKHGIPARWRSIGTLLGVSTGQLEDIERITDSNEDALQKVTYLWLKSPAKYCTWKYLIEGVKHINKKTALEMKEHLHNNV